ncbi:hypothetical protein KOW79_003583 [Hemibagrus wyckioides]|uniref:Uncharacterized protein n=1 Tax=Hemibagrus wyckioides TaxID=337641 RepID=A0A9D3P5W7_9TELE|nr:hypothetical protein KOW79_003583 [Hemibagrus wyckioides]
MKTGFMVAPEFSNEMLCYLETSLKIADVPACSIRYLQPNLRACQRDDLAWLRCVQLPLETAGFVENRQGFRRRWHIRLPTCFPVSLSEKGED